MSPKSSKKNKKDKKRNHRSKEETNENKNDDAENQSDNNDSEDEITKQSRKKRKKEKKRERKPSDDVMKDESDDDNEQKHEKKKKHEKHKKKKNKSITSVDDEDKKHEDTNHKDASNPQEHDPTTNTPRPLATSSALDYKIEKAKQTNNKRGITLLLFYQYVEPPWTNVQFQDALKHCQTSGAKHKLGGRMRIAKEGLNCTLTGKYDAIRAWTAELRLYCPQHFSQTEFKLTDNLGAKQHFPKLNAFQVEELVNYGLGGRYDLHTKEGQGGTHLEPTDYHKKIAEDDTVIIDVRNHYEAVIGHFKPPTGGATMIDPMMRKSTEFPIWLDKPETKEKLRGKQVLMYCTGGVRCERASALLKQKLETEEDMKELGVKGVYQLQGGVDKYFKDFPEGGFWTGKNYTFDKRFAHAPPKLKSDAAAAASSNQKDKELLKPMGKCEACAKPWDMYRGKRRCPTCGVPSLICKECFENDASGKKKLDRTVRCELCVMQNITSKATIKTQEQQDLKQYKLKQKQQQNSTKNTKHNKDSAAAPVEEMEDTTKFKPSPNPNKITRLFVGNLCIRRVDETILVKALPNANCVQWLKDRKTGKFYGSCFVEMDTPEDASVAVGRNGMAVFGRRIKVKYQKPDGKDVWPPSSAIKLK